MRGLRRIALGLAGLLALGAALGWAAWSEREEREGEYFALRRSDVRESEREKEREAEREAERGGERAGEGRVEEEEDADRPTGASDAMRWRYEQRIAGRKVIPLDGLVRAKEQIDAMRGHTRDGGLWSWTWLGPGNVGGRLRAVLVHPTITSRIFVGSVAGGIWRSDNSGGSWTPVNDFLANLAVTSLVFDPTNTNVMYASTGEGFGNVDGLPGAGIFRSADGGVTWSQLASTNQEAFRFVNRLAHHPSATNTLLAATAGTSGSTYGLARSTNGGSTWSFPLNIVTPLTDVKYQPSNGTRVLVGAASLVVDETTNSGSVWLSTDSGASFTPQNGSGTGQLPVVTGRCEVQWGSGSTAYALLDRNGGEVWRTTNLGSDWQKRNGTTQVFGSSGSQGWYDNVIWVDPTSNSNLVIGGIDLWRSTDAGSTFTRISDWSHSYDADSLSAHADHHAIAADPGFNGGSNRRVYFANDGGLFVATNVYTVSAYTGWGSLNNGLGITQFYGAATASDGSRYVGGTQDNSNPVWSGGGTSSWTIAETGDGGVAAVHPTNANILYAEHQYLDFVKSTNGGTTWNDAQSGLTDVGRGSAPFVAPFELDPNSPAILWAGSYRLWRTTNSASAWSSVNNTTVPGGYFVSAIDVKPGNSSEIWAGYTDGSILRSTNNGSTWSTVDDNGANPPPDGRVVTDIAVSPYFSGEALVTLSGYNSDSVWLTGNGGQSWSRRTGTAPDTLPALQVNTISYHPSSPDWIYLGTDLGVLASNDFGLHWSVAPAYPDNDGPANVEVDDIDWYGDRMVVATHGRGLYRARPLETVYVDFRNAGTEDGSQTHPYNTVGEGISASGNGTTLSIANGTYTEGALLFNKAGVIVPTGGAVIVR